MPNITSFIVIFVFCALQYIISRLKWGILGIIMPIIYVICIFYARNNGMIDNTVVFIVLLLAGIAFLVAEWVHGRQDRRNKRVN